MALASEELAATVRVLRRSIATGAAGEVDNACCDVHFCLRRAVRDIRNYEPIAAAVTLISEQATDGAPRAILMCLVGAVENMVEQCNG
jgi:hypothetical protein